MSDADGSRFSLTIEGHEAPLRVISFRGREAISELYVFEIIACTVGESGAPLEETALNRPTRLAVQGHEQPRVLQGIIQSARLLSGVAGWNRGEVFRLTLVPHTWRLSPTRNSRIFQAMDVPKIIIALFEQHGIAFRSTLMRKYEPRDYCVQYQESDYDFMRRLMSEEGIYFYFDHQSAEVTEEGMDISETIVLCDEPSGYQAIAGQAELPMRDDTMAASGDAVSSFDWGGQLQTGRTVLSEYDFLRPPLELRGQAAVKDIPADLAAGGGKPLEGDFAVYNHDGHYLSDHVTKEDAVLQLEQLRARRRTGRGVSHCNRFAAGHTFTLQEAQSSRLNQRYALVSVDHEGRDPFFGDAGEGADAHQYTNRFECVVATTAYRPPRQRWNMQQSFETATVVGPKDSEIYTDEHGRIKVQFHWDLQGKRDEHSSCWIRVMQTWAGTGWGHQFIPRVGMEVLVLLGGGDIDKPMVIGSAYNGAKPPPFDLPQNKTVSGLRTRSTPGSDGFNELSFEDKAGAERVYLKAEKDLDEHVQNDHATTVLNDQSNSVIHNQTETVGDNQSLSVGGSRIETVDVDRARHVGGNETVGVDGNVRVRVGGNRRDSVAGDHQENVDGSHRQRIGNKAALEVGDNLGVRTTGAFMLEVTGDAQSALSANCVQTVGGNHNAIVSGNQLIAVSGNSTLSAAGTLTLAASAVVMQAPAGFSIGCGESSITMHEDSVEIRSPQIIFTGEEELMLRAAGSSIFQMDGKAKLVAEEVELAASGAGLKLDSNAQLDGTKISMGSSGDNASYSDDKEDGKPNEPPKLKVQLMRDWTLKEPFADTKVIVSDHAPEPEELQTDDKGWLEFEVHYERCVITIEMPDEDMEWKLNHGALAEISEEEGVKQRLANLGYGEGGADTWSRREFLSALLDFADVNRVKDEAGEQDAWARAALDNGELSRHHTTDEIDRLVDHYRSQIEEQAGG